MPPSKIFQRRGMDMRISIKTSLALCGCLIITMWLLLVPAYAWGDSDGGRPSYTFEEIESDILGDKVVLNSISDSVNGNEKNFVAAREYNGPNTTGAVNVWNANEITVKDGQDYIIRAYVHNNNLHSENVAKDVSVSFSIPSTAARRLRVNGFIDTSNASPQRYWSYVDFVSDAPFHLEYYYDTALLENNGVGAGGLQLSDEIVTNASGGGTMIGYYDYRTNPSDPIILDGIIPAGYQYSSYITIRVKAVFDTNFNVETKVRMADSEDTSWENSVEATVGDRVEFQIQYTNTSDEDQLSVAAISALPDGLRYVDGSTRIVNSKYPDSAQVNEDTLTTDGFLIGSYGPGADAILTFMAEVTGDNLYEGVNELEGIGQIGVDGRTMQDSATVIVHNGEVPEPEPRPILTPLRILAFAVVCVCFAVIALFIKSHHGKER